MVEDNQIKAQVSPFAIREGEIKTFDGKDGYVSMNQIVHKINIGHINEIHFAILDLVNEFEFITSRQLYQMLEIKVQDSPTIDLGRYSPQFEEQINNNFTTRTIRYLIALTNCVNGAIDGLIICPGEELGKYFTYVAEKSFKCQKSIPMSFFEQYKGDVVFNP